MKSLQQIVKRRYSVFIFFALISPLCFGASHTTTQNQQLTDDYQKVITTGYHELANLPEFKISQADLKTLLNEMSEADKNNKPDHVVGLAVANMNIIQQNINDKETPKLSRLILKNHAAGIVNEILEYAKINGNNNSQASQHFELAKYYASQYQWDDAIAQLKTFDLTNDISAENTDEAYIIVGASLQAKKKHRDALTYYKKIKAESPHYAIAQLNMALVYIRQDWWTDAEVTIDDAIKIARKEDIEIVNRLYTIVGFSQLQQGFYRNARDSFRHVKINSAYSNRALLGIGMSALNQEDFTGAINAFQQLKSHDGNDMSVAQAYLLEAFTLAKLKQNDTAAIQYSEAVNYFGNKANYYGNLLKSFQENSTTSGTLKSITLDEDLQKEQPEIKSLTEKLTLLNKLQSYSISQRTLQQSANIYARLYKNYADTATEALTKKQFVFNSYLNQSNFGLTRLYDTK